MKILILLLFSLSAFALEYEIIEGMIDSKIIKESVPYWAMIPKERTADPLPVVYFLHGRGGNRYQFRDVDGEKLLRAKGKPFAVVGLTGKDSYWVNDVRTVVLSEMIPQIEEKHNLGKSKSRRLVAGISMGSHGAFQLGLTSGLFSCVAGHSLVDRSYESLLEQFPGIFPSRQLYEKKDSLSLLMKIRHRQSLPFKNFYVDIGGKDDPMFLQRARLVEKELLRLGVNEGDFVDIGILDPEGKHDGPYWKQHMSAYLDWYGSCFGL